MYIISVHNSTYRSHIYFSKLIGSRGHLPLSSEETVDLLLFIDKLFDTVNVFLFPSKNSLSNNCVDSHLISPADILESEKEDSLKLLSPKFRQFYEIAYRRFME